MNRFLLLVLLVVLSGCTSGALILEKSVSAQYRSDTGQTMTVDYYRTSDGSLAVVRFVLPDGTKHTLPRLVAASGERYTDEQEYLWWSKGDSAFLERRNDSGEWVTQSTWNTVTP